MPRNYPPPGTAPGLFCLNGSPRHPTDNREKMMKLNTLKSAAAGLVCLVALLAVAPAQAATYTTTIHLRDPLPAKLTSDGGKYNAAENGWDNIKNDKFSNSESGYQPRINAAITGEGTYDVEFDLTPIIVSLVSESGERFDVTFTLESLSGTGHSRYSNHFLSSPGCQPLDYSDLVLSGAGKVVCRYQVGDRSSFNHQFYHYYRVTYPDFRALRPGTYTASAPIINRDFLFNGAVISSKQTTELVLQRSALPFRIQFPTGFERAELLPPGGWSRWVSRREKPAKLASRTDFYVSGTGRFAVGLLCSGGIPSPDGYCNIADESDGQKAAVAVRMTLPELFKHRAQPISRHLLAVRGDYLQMALDVIPTNWQGNSPASGTGSVFFEVEGAELQKLLNKPGSNWTGGASIIFDINPDGYY